MKLNYKICNYSELYFINTMINVLYLTKRYYGLESSYIEYINHCVYEI